VHDRARRDPRKDALLVEQRADAGDRLSVRDEQFPVELGDVEDRGHVAVLERAEAHHRVARQRLGGGDHDVGKAFAEPLARAHQRAAGAEARDEHVDAVERLGDFGAGPFVVGARVRRVAVLERHVVARLLRRQLLRQPHRAVGALGAG